MHYGLYRIIMLIVAEYSDLEMFVIYVYVLKYYL